MRIPMRIDQVFSSAARDAGGVVQLVLRDGTQITYAESYARAAKLAGAMHAAGIVRNDRVAALMRNSRELIEFYIACSIAGVIGVAINAMSTPREIDLLLEDCAPSAILAESSFVRRVSSNPRILSMKLRVVTKQTEPLEGWEIFEELLENSKVMDVVSGASANDPAMMIYSSGTTGAPKGILLRHSALVLNAQMTVEVLGVTGHDRYLSILPMFSSFGFAFDFLQAGLVRASTVLLEQFDPDRAVDCIERFKVTFMGGVPTMFSRIFDLENIGGRDMSSLRLLDVGGGPVAPSLKELLCKEYKMTVVESYGLTEISPVASAQVPGKESSIGSCGAPLPGIKVRVISVDGMPVQPGEVGELQFFSPTFMIGYWNRPEMTASAFDRGWLRSGDIGKVDDAGNIYILDRLKDMIVTNGFNVYPKEVENVICEMLGVQSAAVVGVPDEISGEWIEAFVVLSSGAKLSEQDVLTHCAENLAHYKRPKRVRFVDSMPLTASGKIRRGVLRAAMR